MSAYFSYTQQASHYFNRPYTMIAYDPLESPAAWCGRDLAARDDWRYVLTPPEAIELHLALVHARTTTKPIRELTAIDFPLPRLSKKIEQWRQQVHRGRGFQLISGVPTHQWSSDDAELFFWCLGLHLGRPGAQNYQDDLIGHVVDTGEDAKEPFVRLYRTSAHIAYHCDAADIVGLLCLNAAKKGGTSRIVSSVRVYNELLAIRPDWIPRLYEPFLLDLRNEDQQGGLRYLPIAPCRYDGKMLRTFYHSDYFRSVHRHDTAPPFTDLESDLLGLFEQIASSPDLYFDMDLAPGDIQLLSNHTVMHARTAYEDHPEPEKKRHLLRLWLSQN